MLSACFWFGVYLWWRFTATLNPEAPLLTALLLAAEIYGFLCFLLFAFMVWDVRHQARFALRPDWQVDVYVPTYNEDLDILEATLTGCQAMTYPHTTYVLDDGQRPEVAALAARLGCAYLTRPDNRHAKAGNLNAALPRTQGEFIVVLDADTVPQPDFLEKTLGYFVDEQVALVQLPQEFYNRDSVQHRRSQPTDTDWHEQALFYRVIQAGKNRWNAAFWCGSPSVVRRTALEAVGGVATESVTEDIHTSLRLHARGWKTVYHNEPLAYGIAPQTLSAFATQRLRWAQGTMQILRSRENPLLLPGLTLAQRLNYLASMGAYFEAYQKLILIAVPLVVLLTGSLPMRVGVGDYLVHWAPYLALSTLANLALGRGAFRWWATEQYNVLKMFTFIWASTVLVWPRPLRFRVTPKKADTTVHREEFQLLKAHIITLGLIAVVTVYALVNLFGQVTMTYSDPTLILVTLAWALLNAAILLSALRPVLGRQYRRESYRFPSALPASLQLPAGRPFAGTIDNLSMTGGALTTSHELTPGDWLTIVLHLPEAPLTLRGEVLHRKSLTTETWQLGCQFHPSSPADRNRLARFLFVTAAGQPAARVSKVPPASGPDLARPAGTFHKILTSQGASLG